MVGVWAMCLWEQMGQPNRVNLVELGPGRGTLMADLLRVRNTMHNSRLDFLVLSWMTRDMTGLSSFFSDVGCVKI